MVPLEIDYYEHGAEGIEGLDQINVYLNESSLETNLLELVKLRASQINGCAHCAELHAEKLVDSGEDPLRLYVLSAWPESSYFSKRERVALGWTEAVTQIADGLPDDVYQMALDEFTEQELVTITFAISFINVYNRLAICFREPEIEEV